MNEKVTFGESSETERLSREAQLLMSVLEPDPGYQPLFISDGATFFVVSGQDEAEIEAKLREYFMGELHAPLSTPIWQFIGIVKVRYPGWPEEWPPEHMRLTNRPGRTASPLNWHHFSGQ